MPRLTRSELEGASLVWLLRVSYAGREFLFSSVSISPGAEPVADDGEVKGIDGRIGSDLSIGEEWALMSTISSARSVSFDGVVFPVDVGALIETGHSLSFATGEISLWKRGDSYDDRRVFLTGRLVAPEYGAAHEGVSFSIEENPFDDPALVPASTHRISKVDTWVNAATEATGDYYPIVFGRPGVYVNTLNSEVEVVGSPASIVEQTGGSVATLLIADHAVESSTVTVWDIDGDTSEVFATVTTEADSLGAIVSTVDISGASTISKTKEDYWIEWSNAGALMSDDRTTHMNGAGDVLEWMLLRSSLRVDRGRIAAVKQRLNLFKVAGFIDSPVSPWEWTEDNLLPLLPVSVVSGAEGIYPVVWEMDANAAQAVEKITANQAGGAVRVGPVSYENSPLDVINEIRIDWAYIPTTGKHRMFTTLKGTPDPDSFREFSNYYARASAGRYGSRAETITTEIVYDAATIQRVLNWKIRASGFLHRSVSYRVDKSYGWVNLGNVVTVTDSDLSLSDRVGLVQSITWESEEALILRILLIDDPARDMV